MTPQNQGIKKAIQDAVINKIFENDNKLKIILIICHTFFDLDLFLKFFKANKS